MHAGSSPWAISKQSVWTSGRSVRRLDETVEEA
jgi:hypothetical protein